jgi:5,10-methylenetetrahydrofolate reductase
VTLRLVFELEPPRVPNLNRVIRQIEMWGPLADALLVPDNHLGLPAVSSLALAVEVQNRGFTPIVAMNARDRNPLRARSDLLTLRTYGIQEVLLLGGDRVEGIAPGTTVKQMLNDEAGEGLRKGALATIGKPLGWRLGADFLFTRLAFQRTGIDRWREEEEVASPLYCGVIGLADQAMARKVLEKIPDLHPPSGYLEAFDDDEDFGFRTAIGELDQLSRSRVEGAHLVVPSGRVRFAKLLEEWLPTIRRSRG